MVINVAHVFPLTVENAVIVVDADEPSYVHHTISEVQTQVQGISGFRPLLTYSLLDGLKKDDVLEYGYTVNPDVVIVVGRSMVAELKNYCDVKSSISDSDPGEQGFVIRSFEITAGRVGIMICGSDPMGTNYGLMEFRQRLIESPTGLDYPEGLEIRNSPLYKKRGLYVHQHWKYNYPWATWSWKVEDWKRAIDIAAYLRINRLMIWPHMDTLAPPLNAAEGDYLDDVREIIDYAQDKRGIEVYAVEPANVVIDDIRARSLPMERRHYYEFAQGGMPGIKNPGDVHDFETIVRNRKLFYEYVPNLDGVVYIDGDPGGWKGSKSEEFVRIFEINRKLLDSLAIQPEKASLAYWMWFSWGTNEKFENRRDTLALLIERLKDPWELFFCQTPDYEPETIELLEDFRLLDRSIFFPYGQVEDDGVLSLTQISFDSIAKHLDSVAGLESLRGTMANVLTLLLQLPNVYHFTSYSWGDVRAMDERQILRSLALKIFPEHADLMSEAWDQLNDPGSKPALNLAERVEAINDPGKWGRLGTIGELIFPQPGQILDDLARMLRIQGKAWRTHEVATGESQESPMQNALVCFFAELLEWRRINGYFGAYNADQSILLDRYLHAHQGAVLNMAWSAWNEKHTDVSSLQLAVIDDLISNGFEPSMVQSVTNNLWNPTPL